MTVKVKLGKQRVLEYLFSPLVETVIHGGTMMNLEKPAGYHLAVRGATLLIALIVGLLPVLHSGPAVSATAGNIWYKLCTRERSTAIASEAAAGDICQTIADVRDNKTAVLVGRILVRKLSGQADYELEAIVPLGSALPPGALVRIDQTEPVKLAYKNCDAGGCYARATVGGSFVKQMRTGKKIAFLWVDTKGKAFSIPLPLDRFGEAFDGPETPVDKYHEDQQKLSEVIAKRLAEAGKAPPAPAIKPVFEKAGENAAVNSGWYKLCVEVPVPEKEKANAVSPASKKTGVCLTAMDIRDAESLVLEGKLAVKKIEGRAQWQLLVMLPLRFSIPDGAEASIDAKTKVKLKFTSCDAAGCYAEAELPDAALEELKTGREASYSGIDGKGDTILVPVSLSGFKDAFNGDPVSVEAYNAEMRRLSETIAVRAARQGGEQRP